MSDITRLDVGPRYSEAAIHGGTVYLAGQVAEATAHLGVKEQTSEVLHLIDTLLARAGSRKDRILFAQVFLSNMADYVEFNAAWDAWCPPGHAPPRATVEARLASTHLRVEIVITAAPLHA